MSNIEPQNVEGKDKASFKIRLAAFQAALTPDTYFSLTPETFNF